jgi:hypothetical protein
MTTSNQIDYDKLLISKEKEAARNKRKYLRKTEMKKRKLMDENIRTLSIDTIEGSNEERVHIMAITFEGEILFILRKSESSVYNFEMVAAGAEVCNFGNVTSTIVRIPSHTIVIKLLTTCED